MAMSLMARQRHTTSQHLRQTASAGLRILRTKGRGGSTPPVRTTLLDSATLIHTYWMLAVQAMLEFLFHYLNEFGVEQ
jgi:hypothetical protein